MTSSYRITVCFVLLWFHLGVSGPRLYAASATLASAKQQAEAKGFIFETSHGDIVAKAKQQGGKIQVMSSFDPAVYSHMTRSFKQKYPFLDVTMVESTGQDANERFLLELKAGIVKDFDVVHLAHDRYSEYLSHARKFDLLGMAENGVLNIQPKMIDPKNRSIVSLATALFVAVHNANLISADKVPGTWEGFLNPEFKGRKMMVDIRPLIFSIFASCPDQGLGVEWMVNYAKKIRAQEPIWVRGYSRTLSAINSGEYALHSGSYYHTTVRLLKKSPADNLKIKFIEPVPATLLEPEMVLGSSRNPYGALLFLEHEASAEGQKIIDEHEPLKASIHSPQSVAAKEVKGKKVCLNGYDTFTMSYQWEKMAFEAFGFPSAEVK